MRLESIEEGKGKIFMFGSGEVVYCADLSLTEEKGKRSKLED